MFYKKKQVLQITVATVFYNEIVVLAWTSIRII